MASTRCATASQATGRQKRSELACAGWSAVPVVIEGVKSQAWALQCLREVWFADCGRTQLVDVHPRAAPYVCEMDCLCTGFLRAGSYVRAVPISTASFIVQC